jgi:hypothetical protein
MSHKIIQRGLAFRPRRDSVTTRASAFTRLGILPRRLRCQCGASVVTAPGAVTTERRIPMPEIEMELQIPILRVPRGAKGGPFP